MQRRDTGLLMAALAALISGVSVFVNGYGVRVWAEVSDPTTYTTLKNAGAALILLVTAGLVGRRRSDRAPEVVEPRRNRIGLGVVAVVGGSVPFVLFFEGLALATSTDAAFIHKTLVIWVIVLATVLLHERVGLLQLGAVALLLVGQAVLSGGVDQVSLGPGEWMILAATILWAIETVIAKRLLVTVSPPTLAVARMAGGAALLIGYGLIRGAFSTLGEVTALHLGWIALTAVTLACYVWTWYAALSRAPAVDVTAVLVGGAVITALLETGIRGVELPPVAGLALVATGVVLLMMARARQLTSGP
ncbi:MAG TPA: DMT family transporter [Acidimicrobiia bacterium]|jgi:drug/metabolite transporter (DMT)-like permease